MFRISAFAPFEVIDSVFFNIANGDNLDIRPGENAAELADSLGAKTNASERDLLAGRDRAPAAQGHAAARW